jgi:hypothetical protein
MKKIKITLEIEAKHRNERHASKFEKFVTSFLRLCEIMLASDLRPNAKVKILRLVIISSTLMALTYFLFCVLTLIVNRL